MTGDEHRITVANRVMFDALASGRLTWWGQYSNDGVQLQRGDILVFQRPAGTIGGERPESLRMIVTDERLLTMTLPICGGEQTGDVFVARILSLRPADAVGVPR